MGERKTGTVKPLAELTADEVVAYALENGISDLADLSPAAWQAVRRAEKKGILFKWPDFKWPAPHYIYAAPPPWLREDEG